MCTIPKIRKITLFHLQELLVIDLAIEEVVRVTQSDEVIAETELQSAPALRAEAPMAVR